jgi:hypothetical protein
LIKSWQKEDFMRDQILSFQNGMDEFTQDWLAVVIWE